jgi:hypothetical protein
MVLVYLVPFPSFRPVVSWCCGAVVACSPCSPQALSLCAGPPTLCQPRRACCIGLRRTEYRADCGSLQLYLDSTSHAVCVMLIFVLTASPQYERSSVTRLGQRAFDVSLCRALCFVHFLPAAPSLVANSFALLMSYVVCHVALAVHTKGGDDVPIIRRLIRVPILYCICLFLSLFLS